MLFLQLGLNSNVPVYVDINSYKAGVENRAGLVSGCVGWSIQD